MRLSLSSGFFQISIISLHFYIVIRCQSNLGIGAYGPEHRSWWVGCLCNNDYGVFESYTAFSPMRDALLWWNHSNCINGWMLWQHILDYLDAPQENSLDCLRNERFCREFQHMAVEVFQIHLQQAHAYVKDGCCAQSNLWQQTTASGTYKYCRACSVKLGDANQPYFLPRRTWDEKIYDKSIPQI